jgi:hypothetical protein
LSVYVSVLTTWLIVESVDVGLPVEVPITLPFASTVVVVGVTVVVVVIGVVTVVVVVVGVLTTVTTFLLTLTVFPFFVLEYVIVSKAVDGQVIVLVVVTAVPLDVDVVATGSVVATL